MSDGDQLFKVHVPSIIGRGFLSNEQGKYIDLSFDRIVQDIFIRMMYDVLEMKKSRKLWYTPYLNSE